MAERDDYVSGRDQEIKLAFDECDPDGRGRLSYKQMQRLLMSFGMRPAEQGLDKHLSKTSLVDLDKAIEIVNCVIPLDVMRARILRGFVGEDARQKRRETGNRSSSAIDGLIRPEGLQEVLKGWHLSEAEVEDTLGPYLTPDGRLEYYQLVEGLFEA